MAFTRMIRSQPTRPQTDGAAAPHREARLDALRRKARDGRAMAANARPEGAIARLLQALPWAMGRRVRFFRPGSNELTADEAWLVSVLDAMERADSASYRFLLQTRMSRAAASEMHFLLCAARTTLDRAA